METVLLMVLLIDNHRLALWNLAEVTTQKIQIRVQK